MDPRIGWYQPETAGPARDMWMRIWEAEQVPIPTTKSSGSSETDSQTSSNSKGHGRGKGIVPSTSTFPGRGQPGGQGITRNVEWNRLNDDMLRQENRARTFGLGFNENVKLSHNNGCPWIVDHKKYSKGIIGLHEEIEDFFAYMSPKTEEREVRMIVVDRLKSCVAKLWPQSQVDVYGSFRTGLYLPTSDIDVHIFGPDRNRDKSTMFSKLQRALIQDGIADPSAITILDRASVPLVKIVEKLTDVKVDISFDMMNGVRSAKLVQKFILKYPVLPKLVLVLKQFLLQRDLNQVFTGGISSYSLILLIVSFLQFHERANAGSPVANLAVLLIGFLEFFGKLFNFLKVGIRIKDGGWHLPKEYLLGRMGLYPGSTQSLLCIEDPLAHGNDIGRSSYGIMDVKQAFEYAFITLEQGVKHECGGINVPHINSILGRIIRITDEVISYRVWIIGVYNRHRIALGLDLGLDTRHELPHTRPRIQSQVKNKDEDKENRKKGG